MKEVGVVGRAGMGVAAGLCMMASSVSKLLICALVLAVCAYRAAEAAQCMPDTTNPCKAKCNGTQFDISTLFDYP